MILWQAPSFAQATVAWFRILRRIEGYTEGDRRAKVRHDLVTHAAFLFWHLMRERRTRAGSELNQGENRRQKVRVKVRDDMYLWQTHFGTNIRCLIHQMSRYVKYISSPCCLVCSLLLKQVGNKGKLLVRTFFFEKQKNSFRSCQQVSEQFLKLSLQTLFTRKTCYEAKHTTEANSSCGFLSIFHKA